MSEVKTPNAKAIDTLLLKYDGLKKIADEKAAAKKLADAELEVVKLEVIEMVTEHGSKHAEKSLRLKGIHNTATTTTGSTTVVLDAKVEDLRKYLKSVDEGGLEERFFVQHVTYSLVDSPAEVLKEVTLATRMRNKIAAMIALCFEQKTKSHSLKVEIVTPE